MRLCLRKRSQLDARIAWRGELSESMAKASKGTNHDDAAPVTLFSALNLDRHFKEQLAEAAVRGRSQIPTK